MAGSLLDKSRRTLIDAVLGGFAGQFFLFISGIVVARLLGPEDRGYLALLVIFPVILSQLALVGLPQSLSALVARNSASAWHALPDIGVAITAQLLVSVGVFMAVCYGLSSLIPGSVQSPCLWMSGALPGLLLQAYALAGLQGLHRYSAFNRLRNLSPALFAASCLILAVSCVVDLGAVVAAWVFVQLTAGVSCAIAFVHAASAGRTASGDTTYSRKTLLGFGLRGTLGYMSPLDTFRLDQLVIGLLVSPAVLGLYVVGQAFTNLPRLISQSIGFVAFPAMASRQSVRGEQHLIGSYLSLLLMFLIPTTLLLMMVMPWLVAALFGSEFADAAPIARVLLVGAFFFGIRRVVLEALRGLGCPQCSTYAELSTYPVLFTFTVLLVPSFAGEGMAWAVTAANISGCVASLWLWRWYRERTSTISESVEGSREVRRGEKH